MNPHPVDSGTLSNFFASVQQRSRSRCILLAAASPLLLSVGLLSTSSCLARSRLAGQSAPSSGWTVAQHLSIPRSEHTATRLLDGKVLVAGGSTANQTTTSSAEIYDPATATWTGTGSMSVARASHQAVLLNNGLVMVKGGGSATDRSSEFYDPATGAWTRGPNISPPVVNGFGFTLLADGRVLFNPGSPNRDCELYDPIANQWTPTGRAIFPRSSFTATLLNDGRVLKAGGNNQTTAKPQAELYDPVTGTWAATGRMSKARSFHSAVLLQSGEVLVAGAFYPPDKTTDLYDPITGTWTLSGNMPSRLEQSVMTLLSDGRAMVAGGLDPDSQAINRNSTIYDPSTGTWGALESVQGQHGVGATITTLLDGRVLLVGGRDNNFQPTANVDLYQP